MTSQIYWQRFSDEYGNGHVPQDYWQFLDLNSNLTSEQVDCWCHFLTLLISSETGFDYESKCPSMVGYEKHLQQCPYLRIRTRYHATMIAIRQFFPVFPRCYSNKISGTREALLINKNCIFVSLRETLKINYQHCCNYI